MTAPQNILLAQRRAEFEAAKADYRAEPKVQRYLKARAALAGASRKNTRKEKL